MHQMEHVEYTLKAFAEIKEKHAKGLYSGATDIKDMAID